jgi:2-methylcitrate dehydratase PrpD
MMNKSSQENRVETISEQLSLFALDLKLEQIPISVCAQAKLHMLDAIGIGIASSHYDFAKNILHALMSLQESNDQHYQVLGVPNKLSMRDAILVNGTYIHGLDFDDTHAAGVIHASSSAMAALLSVGQRYNINGQDGLVAYLVAIEVASRIASAANGGFHEKGFHPTGLVGIFGATVLVGRIMKLTAGELTNALGISLSMASGVMEFLEGGAWTKRMHPGWAASSAVTACAMAQNGFIGPRGTFEGRYGLFNTHIDSSNLASLEKCTNGLGQIWEMQNISLKPYPACHYNHAFVDAAVALRQENAFEIKDIQSIKARISEKQVPVVCEPQASKRIPKNSYEAQFSIHFVIATSLIKGKFTLNELENDTIFNPQILALCQKIEYEIDPKSAFPEFYSGEVEIQLKSGKSLIHREQMNRGSSANPLSKQEILEKFYSNVERVMSRTAAKNFTEDFLNLEHQKSFINTMNQLKVY